MLRQGATNTNTATDDSIKLPTSKLSVLTENDLPKPIESAPEDLIYESEKSNPAFIDAALSISDLISVSKLRNPDGSIRIDDLVGKFNEKVKHSAFTTSTMKIPLRDSWYLNPGEVLLGHRNKVPEMMPFNKDKFIMRDMSKPTDTTEVINKPHKITEPYFSLHGTHVLNVPIGKYATGMSGNIPRLFDTGPHVFSDPNFKLEGFHDQSAPHIHYANIHIFRVPITKIAKIMINNRPYLLEARKEPYVFEDPLLSVQENYLVDANSNVITHGSINYIRVPVGNIAKIWINNKPFILPHRNEPYIFNDPLLKLETNADGRYFSDATANVIHHGAIHLIRVPVGKIAKIWLNNVPFLLTARDEPYKFHNPNFHIEMNGNEPLFDATVNVIHHGPIHILRVPVGKLAKIWLNTTPYLLGSRNQPYIFNDALFRIEPNGADNLFDANANVISHGSTHYVRVPSGKIAKIWFNNEPRLLDENSEPYTFEGANFKIDKNGNDFFFDATEQLIVHGSIKRIIPHTSQVAITYNGGILEIMHPKPDRKPILITSPQHSVEGFLSTTIDTLEFPSQEEKDKRRKEKPKASDDEVNLDIYTTKDSLRVGVKIKVSYQIIDPEKALINLPGIQGILTHIESCASVDMGVSVKQSSSQEFLGFVQSQSNDEVNGNNATPVASNKKRSIQEHITDQLRTQLGEYGIKLIRFNIDQTRVMDEELAKELSSQAKQTATVSAKAGVIDLDNQIAQKKASQEAETLQIKQNQVNQAKVSQAKAELEAAKAQAEAILVRAEAEKKATILKAEGEKAAAILIGEQFITNPKLFDLKIAEMQVRMLAAAVEKMQFMPQMQGIFGQPGMGTPFTFFASPTAQTPAIEAAKKPSNVQ